MGASSSKVDTNIINNFMNEIITTSLVKNSNITKQVSSTNQTAKIRVKGDITCTTEGTLIDQQLTSSSVMLTNVSNVDTNEAKNDILSQLDVSNDTTNELIQGFLAGIGTKTDLETVTRVKNDISNVIKNEFTTENINESINSVNVSQDGEITIDGNYTGPCSLVSQTAAVQLQLSQLVDNITKKIVENSSITDVEVETKTTAKLEQTGLTFGMIALIVLAIVFIVLAPVIGAASGGGRGLVIAFLIGLLIMGIFVLIFYLTQKRAPWEPSCVEVCKDSCEGEDEECIECRACSEYCPGKGEFDCKECSQGDTDCYTCQQCAQYCSENCVEDCSGEGLGCIECSSCEQYEGMIPSSAMRVFYPRYM